MNLKSVINVEVDEEDIKNAKSILSRLGLDIDTYVNMALRELIYKNDLPFDNVKPSKELLKAIKEGEDILSGKVKSKGYTNMYLLLEDLKKN